MLCLKSDNASNMPTVIGSDYRSSRVPVSCEFLNVEETIVGETL